MFDTAKPSMICSSLIWSIINFPAVIFSLWQVKRHFIICSLNSTYLVERVAVIKHDSTAFLFYTPFWFKRDNLLYTSLQWKDQKINFIFYLHFTCVMIRVPSLIIYVIHAILIPSLLENFGGLLLRSDA